MDTSVSDLKSTLLEAMELVRKIQAGDFVTWRIDKGEGYLEAVTGADSHMIWDHEVPKTVSEFCAMLACLSEKSWFDSVSLRSLASELAKYERRPNT